MCGTRREAPIVEEEPTVVASSPQGLGSAPRAGAGATAESPNMEAIGKPVKQSEGEKAKSDPEFKADGKSYCRFQFGDKYKTADNPGGVCGAYGHRALHHLQCLKAEKAEENKKRLADRNNAGAGNY